MAGPGHRYPSPSPDCVLWRLRPSWEYSLDAAGRASGTKRNYFFTMGRLGCFLEENDLPTAPKKILRKHLEMFLAHARETTSPGNAAFHWRNLGPLFTWLEEEGELSGKGNPMAKVPRPKVAAVPRPQLEDEHIRALLATCPERSRDFMERRDRLIIRLLLDTGMRVSGLCGLRYDPAPEHAEVDNPGHNDVFLARKLLRIRLKGGKVIMVPIGKAAARDMDRYLRARAQRPQAGDGALLLGIRGALGVKGVQRALDRRAEQAGLETGVHPHRFRRTFAHLWMSSGGTESDLMRIAGWSSMQMVQLYAGYAADQRAQAAHAEFSPGDRF
ncbi:tyrosine-type recombinase/integrase [Nocardiopsis synnemataformans]|uniref:tyrosine-type recombinase/integrase n=1 Tax=Nocardiopsis synnemataformans TaxID=61305 RepID=UPI003EB902A5